jgi:hypothetical protein
MKNIIYILLIILIPVFGRSQESDEVTIKKNNLYVTAGTMLIGNSLNLSYERNLSSFNKGLVNLKLAGGLWHFWEDAGYEGIASWVYLLGKNNKHLELDMGIHFRYDHVELSSSTYSKRFFAWYEFMPHAAIGYRYVNPENGFILRTGIGTEFIYFGVGATF